MKLETTQVGPTNREVFYHRAGTGEPLLYLHGLLGLSGCKPILEQLARNFHVIAPYAPGWGPAKEQLPDIDEGPLDLVLHQCDILNAFGLDSAHVSGIGIGAWMAAELAAIAPGKVDKLALINPLGLWLDEVGGEDPFAQHPGWPSRLLFADPDGRARHLLEGRDGMDAHVEELLNLRAGAKFLWPIPDTGIARRLPRILAPTLLVTSDQDVVVPEPYGPAWQGLIPGSRLVRLQKAGQAADMDQPEALGSTIAGFLAGKAVAAVA